MLSTTKQSRVRPARPVTGDDRIFGGLTETFASLFPEGEQKRNKSRQDLIHAGYYGRHAWHNLAAIRYVGIILPILLCGIGLVFGPTELEPLMIIGLVVGPSVGWAVPKLYVQMQASERKRDIERAMPDMLDLLNMCVSQGMTLPAALDRVSREIKPVYPALAQELAIVTEQARVGTMEQAIQNFADRLDVPEVHSFTSLLVQTEQMGTSVSEALADHSDNIRAALRHRADKAANTAAFKLLFPTTLLLMPAVLLFLLGPAIVDLTDFFSGESGAAYRETRASAQQQLNELSDEQ
jgi:tight adherence protein C